MLSEPKYHFTQDFFDCIPDYEGIRLYQVGRLYCGSDMEVGRHAHCGWFEITSVRGGQGEIFTGDTPQSVSAGDLYLSFPCDIHAIRSSKENPLKYDFFSFSTELSPYREKLDDIMAQYLAPDKRLFHDRRLEHCIGELILTTAKKEIMADALCASLMREILIYLIRDFSGSTVSPAETPNISKRTADELCFQLMQYIDTHLYTMKSLATLSDLTGYNYSYLSTLFKQVTSQTLGSYYRTKRLEAAQVLLRDEHLTAARTAELLGYSSASAFGKAYRAYFGSSPGTTK